MKKKRILYIEANRDGTIGGSYYSLLYLIQGLDKAKYEPYVMFCQDNVLIPEFKKVTPYVYVNDFGPSVSAPCKSLEDRVKWLPRFFLDVIFKQFKLRKIINEIRPDLVHLNNGYAAMHEWMLAGWLHGFKVIAHDRGTGFPCSLRTRLFVRLLDAIINVSDSFRNNVISQQLKVKLVRRVYNGLDSEMIERSVDHDVVNRLKDEFKITAGQPVVGITGNIDRWKGQAVVLKAIKRVRQAYPGIKCLIVGKVARQAEDYKKELDEYIADNSLQNNVIFTGFRKDIPNLLMILDIMLHASIEPEPFGRVVLEGMAAGKPIIATNSGGTVEQIVNGETGILVPMNDPDEMANAIIYFISNPDAAGAMGKNGKERLTELFSIKRMVQETEQVYAEILNSRVIKIAIVITGLGIGGTETNRLRLAKTINRDRYHLTFFCLFDEDNSLIPEFEKAGCNVHVVKVFDYKKPFPMRINYIAVIRLACLLKEGRYDVVQTHLGYANTVGRIAAVIAGCKKILATEHNMTVKTPWQIRWDRFLAPFTYKIVCVSKSVKDIVSKQPGIKHDQCVVVYNGIDINTYRPTMPRNMAKKLIGLSADNIVIGSIGRLHAVKGYDSLVRAFSLTLKYQEDARLILVGDGSERKNLEHLVSSLGISDQVHFLGFRRDIRSILNAMDIFVLSSHSEGFNNALIEAMAAGVPVISTDITAAREIITPTVNGVLVEAKNPDALASSILSLILNESIQSRFIENALHCVEERFSEQQMVSEYERLYSELTDVQHP